ELQQAKYYNMIIFNLQVHFSVRFASGGGGKRDRTADLLHAMQALSQLSYTPGTNSKDKHFTVSFSACKVPFGKLRGVATVAVQRCSLFVSAFSEETELC